MTLQEMPCHRQLTCLAGVTQTRRLPDRLDLKLGGQCGLPMHVMYEIKHIQYLPTYYLYCLGVHRTAHSLIARER
jgi:hypothetical protein